MLDYTKLTPAVDRAAGIASSKFPAHHDIDDVKQSIWVWIMENKNTVTRVLTDADTGVEALDRLLVKAASAYLKTEDAATYGYQQEDRFYYSADLIKSILEVIFDYEDWQSFAMSQDSQPRAKSEPALGGNNLASYADVKSAVEKLPEDQYNAILWRYKYHYTQAQIGEAMDFTRQRAQQVLDASVRAIQRSLGEMSLSELRSGFSGRTEPRNSASGQAQVERDYSG